MSPRRPPRNCPNPSARPSARRAKKPRAQGDIVKWVFLSVFVIAVLMSGVANMTLPRDDKLGVPTLVWVTDDNPARQEQMQLFRQWHREHYGEEVDIRIDPSNYDRGKIVVQSLSGAGPDVFDYYGASQLERYVASGILLDVTEVARDKGFSKEVVWEGIWPNFVSEGRQYGFPDNVNVELILYHKDMFDRAGVPYPDGDWTWEEFIEVARKLAGASPDARRQYALLRVEPSMMMRQNGARMFSPEGTRCTWNSPEAVEALEFYHNLRAKHHVMPTAAELESHATAGGWGVGQINIFATKRFAMTQAGRWWFVGFERDARQMIAHGKKPPFDLGVVEPPHFGRHYYTGGARCTGISRTSRNRKYALRFLEYLASKPFNRQINRTYDAIAPVVEHCTGPTGIADGPEPIEGLEAADSKVWADAMAEVKPEEISPFIPPYRVEKLWREHKELLDADAATAEEVLEEFAQLVDDEIRRNVERDPDLKQRYKKAMRKEERQTVGLLAQSVGGR
ncbi:MAG: extracellular solute-binding protein [Chitinivibrionales bacterium]|nr:extracellular solute-binding protein [Chitinivibrionales bacterium]MBD3395958.1 extracellular solute-binding protein [Chitinivibrionales bacterium]